MFIFDGWGAVLNKTQELVSTNPSREIAIVTTSNSLKESIPTFQQKGYTSIEIKDNDTGKKYPAPNAFIDINGLENIKNYTLTLKKMENGKENEYTVEHSESGEYKFSKNGQEDSVATDTATKFKFLITKKDEIDVNTWNLITSGSIDLGKYISDRGWETEFKNWVAQEQRKKDNNREENIRNIYETTAAPIIFQQNQQMLKEDQADVTAYNKESAEKGKKNRDDDNRA